MKRKLKTNIKIIISCVIILLAICLFLVTFKYLKDKNYNDPLIDDNVEEKIKDMDEEDIYYEDALKELGYSEFDIKYINYRFSKKDIEKYLLGKTNQGISDYMKSINFKIEHLDRYLSYDKLNDYDKNTVVIYVEIGLDQEFYTNIKEVIDYDSEQVLVNKYHKLPSNYEANDLVVIEKPYSNSSQSIKDVVLDPLKQMIDAAKEENLKLQVISAYRTESVQKYLFNNSKKKNGLEHALIYSAKPGHSEHQTGFAVDLNSVEETFADTKQYAWLKENAYKYGFIERYPKGKEFITGYGYEPWHYRYVGNGVANIINNENITFEEYVVKYLN